MISPKDDKTTAAHDMLVKKLKQMVMSQQRALQIQELKMKRLAQEVRELKTENSHLKEKARQHG